MDPKIFFDLNADLGKLPPFPDLPARKRIIWLASYPKSGNTWMRLFLNAYLSGKSEADINQDLMKNHQCIDPVLSEFLAKKPVTEFSNLDAARVRVPVQRFFARSAEKIFVKTHSAVATAYGHPSIDAATTYATILVLRNPLAVLPSFARHMGTSIDEAIKSMDSAQNMIGNLKDGFPTILLSSWSKFTRSWIESSRQLNLISVKYEDMKENPVEAFGKVLAHIHLPVDRDQILKAVNATDFEKLKAQDIAQGFKERTKADKGAVFFRSGKTEGWRDELTEPQIIATIKNHWDVMEQLNYIPTDLQDEFETIKIDALEALVDQGVNIGIYAEDLNQLRAKRGIKTRLKVKASKTQIKPKDVLKNRSKARPTAKKTFG